MENEAFELAATLLRKADYITALTGAGISTPSGIPDFRSPTSGIWEKYDPAEVASLHGFRRDPRKFYDWIRPLIRTLVEAQPNAAHTALARMEATGKLKSVSTQNIDMLHTAAGSQTVYELHGHLREMTCIHCFAVYPAQPFIENFLAAEDDEMNYSDQQDESADPLANLPRCPNCNHVLKPNVILYGEQLPINKLVAARNEASECDLMIVAGSSLEVFPAAELPMIARRKNAGLIIVDLRPTAMDWLASVVLRGNVVDILPRLADV
ncbi:MAG: NAD-dependent deacylase, partial [Anaerolineae bacterium]|nr:NAD-dependent deacylase [Anaerolineae bacterium]